MPKTKLPAPDGMLLSGISFLCPWDDGTPTKVERVFQAIEATVPGVRIGFEHKHKRVLKTVNGVETEVHTNWSVDLGTDRLATLGHIISKGKHGVFWNGDFQRRFQVLVTPRNIYSGSAALSKSNGYEINVSSEHDDFDVERLFKNVAQACDAQYAMSCHLPTRLLGEFSVVDSLLRRWTAGIDDVLNYDPVRGRPKNFEKYQASVALLPRLPHLWPQTSSDEPRAVPRILWLNYWNADTAAFYGFPNPDLDARLLPLAEQLPNGAWFFKLTPEPFDLTLPDHQEMLVWAYQRFTPVGRPVTPAEEAAERARKEASEEFSRRARSMLAGRRIGPISPQQAMALAKKLTTKLGKKGKGDDHSESE